MQVARLASTTCDLHRYSVLNCISSSVKMFDTEQFISEIESRPALYDLQVSDYSNRDVKLKLWLEIANKILPGFKEMENELKNEEVKNLQRKWKSIRDSFMRELRMQKNTPSGSGKKNRKQYVFFEQLLFLLPTIGNAETSSNVENQEIATTSRNTETIRNETDFSDNREKNTSQAHTSRKRKMPAFEEKVLDFLNNSRNKRTSNSDDEDDDKLFLLSLLRPIKALPQQIRFGLRMQMMQLVQNAAQQQEQYQQPQQYRCPQQYQSQQQYQLQQFQKPQYQQQPRGSSFSISTPVLSPLSEETTTATHEYTNPASGTTTVTYEYTNPSSVESQLSTQSDVYSVIDI